LSLTNLSTKRQRIAELARMERGVALSTLHHVVDLEWMQEAHRLTRKDGAPGIDGVTADDYATNLDANLLDLLDRVKSGRYQAPPVRRTYYSRRPRCSRRSRRPQVLRGSGAVTPTCRSRARGSQRANRHRPVLPWRRCSRPQRGCHGRRLSTPPYFSMRGRRLLPARCRPEGSHQRGDPSRGHRRAVRLDR